VWPLAAVACRPLQHSLIARRGLLLAIRQQCLARHLLRILHVEGVFCRLCRLRCKVIASTRRIRPHSLQQAVALFSRLAAPRAARKAGWLAQGWLVHRVPRSPPCLADRQGMARSHQRKGRTPFYSCLTFFVVATGFDTGFAAGFAAFQRYLMMWGRLTLSCSLFFLLFSSTSRYGFSRSFTRAERHENPRPAAVLALSRMTVRPLLDP